LYFYDLTHVKSDAFDIIAPVVKDRRIQSLAGSRGAYSGAPLQVIYPIIGGLLGALVPAGAFLMRYLSADPVLVRLWTWSEFDYNRNFYVYMFIGSVIFFVAFGYVVGRSSERQRVHNRRLRRRVEDLHLQSVTDGLTGLYSHAYLMETLGIEIERAKRHNHPVSLLMLDIDDFKKINDTHGHLFGDQVLKDVTETMSMQVRQEDVVGRYGGEEFLVIMPGADAEVAQTVAERVRKAIARHAVVDEAERGEQHPVQPTVSIGATTYYGKDAGDTKALIREADKRLYVAKRSGKDRVIGVETQV
jgi:diguanylate cyclase (GGDEF)-like protein